MGIFDKLKNLDRLKNPALIELIKDQRLKEVVTRREFRVTEEYFHREFIAKALDEEMQELSLRFFDGYGEITGKVKKRPIPFTIPFSVRFAVEAVDFTPKGKVLHLKVEEVKPLDLDWVTGKVVERIPFLSYREGVITCDLTKVPRLADLFAYQIKGVRLCDFLTVKELLLKEGEVIGRLGFIL
ncbi:MAG: hypothetical protein FD174_537 [Geobacteraceae bacterium]|nr:MAG: hypothetical protein FD174_537 [Geobacteraceae bacterium]